MKTRKTLFSSFIGILLFIIFPQNLFAESFCPEDLFSSYDSLYDQTTDWHVIINWEGLDPESYNPEKFTITLCNESHTSFANIDFYGEGGKIPYIESFSIFPECDSKIAILELSYEVSPENEPKLGLFKLYKSIALNLENNESIFSRLSTEETLDQAHFDLNVTVSEFCEVSLSK